MQLINVQFLHVLDSVVIPRDYPEVSSRAADKTVLRSRHFKEPFATLHTPPLQGWSVCSDKKTVKNILLFLSTSNS